ncbi:MAG: S53 family peptidase, partial [Thermoguttaceae bacterium]
MFTLSKRRRANELSKRAKIGRRKCTFEPLETRSLLSANALSEIHAYPLAQAMTSVSAPYTPSEIRQAYGISSLTGNGAGQTIAIVDAYDNPNVWSNLQAFDAKYGLSDPTFVKVNQNGSSTSLPQKNSDWGLEIALDVEWAHAVAPGAKIILVEANSDSLSNLLTAVKYASSVASVVSISWGASEFSSETQYDSYFSTTGVTYVVSSGDTGGMTIWPAVSPKVVSVGGTTLKISSSGSNVYSYNSETGWSGSGGGYSQYEKEPTWQYAVQSTGRRSTPDVSYDANSSTGFAVYDTYGYSGWLEVGGTSAGAPQWAGIFAVVNQGRGAKGISNAASDLYALDTTTNYSTDFYDITSGSAGRNKAATGYDLVTGLGSPKAYSLVSMLIASSDTVLSKSTSSSGTSSGNIFNGYNTPGWGPFGPRRYAELASGVGQMVSADSLDMAGSIGVASNAVDPTQLLSTGMVRISAGSSNTADSMANALTDTIMGRQHNLETILPYSNALSLNLFDG